MPSTNFVDSVEYNDYSDEDDETSMYDEPMDYQQWVEWYREDLVNMWMGLRGYTEDTYLRGPLLGSMSMDDFCNFVYQFSSTCPHKNAN